MSQNIPAVDSGSSHSGSTLLHGPIPRHGQSLPFGSGPKISSVPSSSFALSSIGATYGLEGRSLGSVWGGYSSGGSLALASSASDNRRSGESDLYKTWLTNTTLEAGSTWAS